MCITNQPKVCTCMFNNTKDPIRETNITATRSEWTKIMRKELVAETLSIYLKCAVALKHLFFSVVKILKADKYEYEWLEVILRNELNWHSRLDSRYLNNVFF